MPNDENERLKIVERFLKTEFSKEEDLQEIANLAAMVCQTPTALIAIVDKTLQIIKCKIGFEADTMPREDAFCNITIQHHEPTIVEDTLADERFKNNPLVKQKNPIRFYAGVPLTTFDGYNLGALCVIDYQPRKLTAYQVQILTQFAKQAINLLEYDTSLSVLKMQVEEVKNTELKLRAFFESSTSCHMLFGLNWEMLAFNRTLAHFAKVIYNMDVYVGMHANDLFPPDLLIDFKENYCKALAGQSVTKERMAMHNDLKVWWYLTYWPARTPEGEIIGVSFNATDITRRVNEEHELLLQNQALRNIAFLHSHELRKPVASILGLLEVIKHDHYQTTPDELSMFAKAAAELDEKMRAITSITA